MGSDPFSCQYDKKSLWNLRENNMSNSCRILGEKCKNKAWSGSIVNGNFESLHLPYTLIKLDLATSPTMAINFIFVLRRFRSSHSGWFQTFFDIYRYSRMHFHHVAVDLLLFSFNRWSMLTQPLLLLLLRNWIICAGLDEFEWSDLTSEVLTALSVLCDYV